MNSIPPVGQLPLNFYSQNNMNLSQFLNNHHKLLSQTLNTQLQENQKVQEVQICSLLNQQSIKWEEFLQNVLLQMAEFEKVMTLHFQKLSEEFVMELNKLNSSLSDIRGKTNDLKTKVEKQMSFMQNFPSIIKPVDDNNVGKNDVMSSISIPTEKECMADRYNQDLFPTVDKSDIDKKSSASVPPSTPSRNFSSTSNTQKNLVITDLTASESLSQISEQSVSVFNASSKVISNSPVTLAEPTKMSKSGKRKNKKKKKAAKNCSDVLKDQVIAPTQQEICTVNRWLNDASGTTAEVPVENVSSLLEFGFNKTNEVVNKASQLVANFDSLPESESQFIDNELLDNVLNKEKLHINVFYHRVQFVTNCFQSVGQLLLYLEKSDQFSLTDCWVEKKI